MNRKKKKLLEGLASQGFKIIGDTPYTQCYYCGKDIELYTDDFDDPDGEKWAECRKCGFNIDYHAKDY